MFEIQQQLITHLPAKRKNTAKGWISFNAVCCHHRGHNSDTKNRGGLLPNNDGNTSYHCFNCGFTANWQPGRRLNLKMRRLLQWLGMNEDEIRRLSLFALSQLDNSLELKKEQITELPKFPVTDPCPGRNLLDWFAYENSAEDQAQLEKIVEYIDARGLGDCLEQFHWSNDDSLRNRVLIPYSFLNQPVGYTGRLIKDGYPKYLNVQPPDFVFNYDYQHKDAKFCFVMEGPFDAIAMNGLAILSNECSEQQALIIESLNRETILVPDRDKAGVKLIKDAMDYGWNVAFPDWHSDVKDVSHAVQRYGYLFTMQSIINSVETSNLKIQLRSKKWRN